MRAFLPLVLVCAGIVASTACGGDSTSNGAGHATGGAGGASGTTGGASATAGAGGEAAPFTGNLPPDTVLDDLTDEQYRAYCEQAAAYIIEQNQDTLCRYAAQNQGDLCEGVYAMCLVAPPELLMQQVPVIDCTKPADCAATAAEMDACVTGIGSAVPSDPTPPCGDAGAAAPPLGGTNLPVACVGAMTACPGFLTGDPGAGGAGGAGGPALTAGAGG
jgi:hypothetical protein